VSSKQPPPFRAWLIPLIIFVVDVVIFAVLGAMGMIEKLPPLMQAYFGASTVAFPIIIYLFLKKRGPRSAD